MIRRYVFGIDPGTKQSALVIVDAGTGIVVGRCTEENTVIRTMLREEWDTPARALSEKILVVEQIESMGMIVGREVYETVWWAGRFHEAWGGEAFAHRVTRREVKLHLCGSSRAKDGNVRRVLLDRYGGSTALGRKNNPGPLYGMRGHEFAALAVALTYIDLNLGGVTWQDDAGGQKSLKPLATSLSTKTV